MTTHPVIHTLHDAGLAIWSGGSLMGAIGLNGAAAALDDPSERASASTAGWSRWAPVNAAGVAAHLIGATGLLVNDWPRVRSQEGVATSSAAKAVATGAALGVAAWSAVLNRKMARSVPAPVAGATEPSSQTPPDVARTQQQLKLVQWLNPLVGFGLIAITAWQEEQQRTAQVAQGVLKRSLGGSRTPLLAGTAAVGLGLLAARRRSSSSSTDTAQDSSRAVGTAGTATSGTATPGMRSTPTTTPTTGTAGTATGTTTVTPGGAASTGDALDLTDAERTDEGGVIDLETTKDGAVTYP